MMAFNAPETEFSSVGEYFYIFFCFHVQSDYIRGLFSSNIFTVECAKLKLLPVKKDDGVKESALHLL